MLFRASIGFVLFTTACGGKVVFDQSQGGAGGTGGGTTSVHVASSAVASSGPSTAAVTTVSTGSGGLMSCSEFGFRGISAPCPMQEGQKCVVDHSCCDVEATCTNGAWQVSGGPACGQPCIDCGGSLGCDTQSICVVGQPDIGGTWYSCAENTCAPTPLDCSCAASACAIPGLQCGGTMSPTMLYCDCPNC